MNRFFVAAAAAICALSLAAAPAEAKKKPAADQSGAEQGQQAGGPTPQQEQAPPRYQPFPHNQNFELKEINGKAPPVEMWLNIDATGHARGFSGCKNWSAVFIIGGERLGPKSMPAINERKCDGALAGIERDFWNVMMSGPYWDTKGDELTLKGFKGGVLRFQRTL